MDRIDELAEEYGTAIPVYGHAAEGNVHPHIMNVDVKTPEYYEELKDEIYKTTFDLGGITTEEHEVGATRIKNLAMVLSEEERMLVGKNQEDL